MLADRGVVFEPLELVERRQEGVLVVQVHDIADGHVAVAEMVHEAAAAGELVQRPAGGVLGQTGAVLLRRNLPQLLEADAEFLRLGLVAQVVPGHDRLGQRAAHAFGDEDVFAVQLDAGLEVVGRLAVAVDAEDAGDDALHPAGRFVPDHMAGGHAGIDLDAQRLGLFAQPAGEIAQRGDVAAVIVHDRRQQGHGQGGLAHGPQDHEPVLGDRRLQRRAAFLPVGEQLVQRLRIDHRTGQDVPADLGRLLQHGDGDLLSVPFCPLFKADGGGQAGGTAADDDDVILHDLALHPGQGLGGRQLVDHGFLPGVGCAAFDGVLGHGMSSQSVGSCCFPLIRR